jgi:hypothetical protein
VSGYRRSYWKTVVAGLGVAAGALAALVILAAVVPPRLGSSVAWLGWAVAVVFAAAAAAGATLVASGGLIALRRDTLEARGIPYATGVPREWLPGPAVAALVRAFRSFTPPRRDGRLDLRPGESVEIRSLPEILATLDARGTLDGLPFMPEMAASCGKRFRVFRRVDKLNDWVGHTGLRRLRGTVLLERLRCDGAGHGGCQANCALRWKEAWLRRADTSANMPGDAGADPRARPPLVGEADLLRLASRTDASGEKRYVCQVTELAAGTTPLAWADPRHYLRDLARGNVRPGPLLAGISLALFNRVQRARRGVAFPCYTVMDGKASPHETLDLRPGEVVRVKTKGAIEPTLNALNRNRGLKFDPELLRFAGGEYRVLTRVERLIEESTGKLIHLTNPSIILDGVTATAEYNAFCAQNESIFWREIWLERATGGRPPL